MVAGVNVVSSPRDLYLCGLQCQRDSDCRYFMDTETKSTDAVCSETPGLLQPSVVYTIRRKVALPGKSLSVHLSYRRFNMEYGIV